jgi:hypothetical protein
MLTIRPRNRLAQPNHTLQLSHRNPIRVPPRPRRIVLPQLPILLDQHVRRLRRHFRIKRPRIPNVALQRLRAELGVDRLVLESMHVHDVPCEIRIRLLVALIQDHEEQIEPAHDRSGHHHVRSERLLAIVPSSDGVRSSENARACVQGRLDTRLGDRDGLLLHRLVNGDLVGDIHLVELVDRADAVVGEHQRTGFDREVASLFVADDGGSETRCGGGFA